MTTTQTELRLAKRMSRLGTETAFEVLVRARALEAQGKNIIHLEIGEPDFDTPANVIEAGVDALHRASRTMARRPDCPSCARPSPTTSRIARHQGPPDEVVVVPGGKPIIFFTIPALVEKATRSSIPTPASPSTSR